MIDIRHFKYMVALAQEMHFTSAAKLLNIAQPALSQSIRQLEQEIGVELFSRNTRNVTLTPAGKVFYREAIKTLQHLEGAIQTTQRASRGEQSTLLIGFSTSAMCAYLPSILRSFHETHPSVGLQFTEFLTDDSVVDALRQNQIDLGCIQRCLRIDTIESFLLKQVPVVVALHHKHRLASSSSIRLRELVGETFITPTRTRYNYLPDGSIPRLWKRAGINPKVGYHVESFSSALGIVAANLGVCILYDPVNVYHQDVVYVKIADFPATLPMQLLWRKGAYLKEIEFFIECARKITSKALSRTKTRRVPPIR